MKTIPALSLFMALCINSAAQNLAVNYEGTNAIGIPTNWPTFTRPIGTNAIAPGANAVMTQAQIDTLKASLIASYRNAITALASNSEVARVGQERTNAIEGAIASITDTNIVSRFDRAMAIATMNSLNNIRTQSAVGLSALTTQQMVNAISNLIRNDPR